MSSAQSAFSAGIGNIWNTESSHVGLYLVFCLLCYVVYEQLRLRFAGLKSSGRLVPGPMVAVPFLGALVKIVRDPYGFWDRQRKWGWSTGFSFNSILGKYMIFITDAEKARELMLVDDPTKMQMALHPAATSIFGKNNMIFGQGPEHKAIRGSFLSLFTRKALSVYIQLQDGIIRRHLSTWLEKFEGKEFEIRPHIRDLNQMTSQEVFIGPYLDDAETRALFSQGYRNITEAFLAFPLCVPGTAVWRGRCSRIYIMKALEGIVSRARKYIQNGGEPRCLADFWVRRCLEEIAEAEAEGVPPPFYTTDQKMADAMLLFLFASQDATTAALVWATALMADHPDILARIRAEQYSLRGNELEKTLDGELINQMVFTRQVVKEILRYRAPAPMLPLFSQCPYQLTQDYTIPRGSIVISSINSACMQGFTDAEKFDPDRFGPDRKEDIVHSRNYLVFGAGSHLCVGKDYAINQLVCYLAILSTSCDWTRRRTEKSDDWQYLPTIYPYDSFITLRSRKDHAAGVATSAYP